MKYSINNYVDALVQVLGDAPDERKEEALKNFVTLLSKNGDIAKRNKIVEAVHKKLVNSNGGRWVIIELARETDNRKLDLIKGSFSAKDHVDVRINTRLVAGIRVTVDGEEEMDNSLDNKLKKLFK